MSNPDGSAHGASTRFKVMHVERYVHHTSEKSGSYWEPQGPRWIERLARPSGDVESAIVEFPCPACGRTVAARVMSRAAWLRARWRRIRSGLLAWAAAAALVTLMYLLLAPKPSGREAYWWEFVLGVLMLITACVLTLYGLARLIHGSTLKGVQVEGESVPETTQGELAPEDQFHTDGFRFVSQAP